MKIKNIELKNIGPYIDVNKLEFAINNKNRNIVLIGGKNGAGKTSLFNAVKICLYGCRVFGYESNNQYYFESVNKLINFQEKMQKNCDAHVLAEILLEDGKRDYIYSLKRQWIIDGKKTRETFVVIKNGQSLSEKEKTDFENYIFQLIPPDMFKFYFFDGEKIADFVFDGVKDSDFKSAFLKLCGLDTLELILNNFRRTYRGSTNRSSLAAEYECIQSKKLSINEQIDIKNADKAQNLKSIVAVEEELAVLESAYSNAGGVEVNAWKKMHEEIRKQEALRLDKRKWLKDIANNVIPFIILSEQLNKLKNQIELESKIRSEQIVRKEIENPLLAQKLESIFVAVHFEHANDLTTTVIEEIIKSISTQQNGDRTEYLSLSPREQLDLIGRINSLLSFDIKRIEEATKEISKSLEKTEKIREKIKKSTVMDFEAFLSAKNELIEKKAALVNNSMLIEKELFELITKDLQIDAEFKKIKAKYEEELKDKSIQNISARAILAFEELQNRLYRSFINHVEESFQKTFNSLINKDDLIDGIFVDDYLRVIPYKNMSYDRQELLSLQQKFGDEHLLGLLGTRAFEKFQTEILSKNKNIVLPVEVKQQLSAGEKQIFIMSLYKALVGLNKVNVPYIIDTPFARIDGEHRKKILSEFFLKLTGQVIILSTDEEIVGEYKEIISQRISNTFVLQHETSGNTSIISNKYFKE